MVRFRANFDSQVSRISQKGASAMTVLNVTDGTVAGLGSSPRRLAVHAPATGEWLADVRISTAEQIEEALARARTAQARWASMPLELRCERVLVFRDALVDRADELIDLL